MISYIAAPVLGLHEPRQRRTFAFTTGIYNYGYVPLPLIQKLFDAQTTAVLLSIMSGWKSRFGPPV